jgi:hypothetical protein
VFVTVVEVVEIDVEVVSVVVDDVKGVKVELSVIVLVEVTRGGVVKVVCEEIPVANTPTLAIGPEIEKRATTPQIINRARNGTRRTVR